MYKFGGNGNGKAVTRKAFKRSLSKGNPFTEGNNREARRKAEREANKNAKAQSNSRV